MKLKTVRLDMAIVPTHDPLILRRQYGELEERLQRSAHTDHFTRGERDQMREQLQGLNTTYLAVTGFLIK